MPVLVGCSGWQYKDWKDRLYAGVPQRAWLESYASVFSTVEVNNAFYRLPDQSVFEAWRARTPADFCVAVKASRYLTHVKRLKDPGEPVSRLLDRAAGLGDRLGPVLLQLPPTLQADAALLDECLAAVGGRVRVAVEFRHPSWYVDTVRSVLESRGAALCWADRRSRPVSPLWRTAPFGYVRFHEGGSRDWPRYGRRALTSWAERVCEQWPRGDVFAYFNNDQHGAAVVDAGALADALRRAGRAVGRVDSERAQASAAGDASRS